jgi:uncharacterized protein YcbK (DUF882 family)
MSCPNPRRRFLHQALHQAVHHGARIGALAGTAALWPATAAVGKAMPAGNDARQLAFAHTHTGERLQLVYAHGAQYLDEAMGALNRLLRDHYSGTVGRIDPTLFDLLHQVQHSLGARMPFEVISGYRSPATNAHLRTSRGGGVAKRSLHMDGRAIDVRLPGVPLAELRDAARALKGGGVGYYPQDRFVHIDTGPVRHW